MREDLDSNYSWGHHRRPIPYDPTYVYADMEGQPPPTDSASVLAQLVAKEQVPFMWDYRDAGPEPPEALLDAVRDAWDSIEDSWDKWCTFEIVFAGNSYRGLGKLTSTPHVTIYDAVQRCLAELRTLLMFEIEVLRWTEVPLKDRWIWDEEAEEWMREVGNLPDPFDDDTPLECGIEDPEVCESCQ